MITHVLDSNLLILHLAGNRELLFPAGTVAVSTLTVFEVLRLPGMSNEEETALRELLLLCRPVSVSPAIAERAALLSRTSPTNRPIDLLIAATALELDVPLVTKNRRHFKSIPGLNVVEKLG